MVADRQRPATYGVVGLVDARKLKAWRALVLVRVQVAVVAANGGAQG